MSDTFKALENRSQFALHPIGGLFDGFRVRYISWNRQNRHTEAPQFGRRKSCAGSHESRRLVLKVLTAFFTRPRVGVV